MLSSTFVLGHPRVSVLNGYRAIRHASRNTGPSPESIEKFIQMADSKVLGFDPWGQHTPMFDLHVPTPWSTLFKHASLPEGLKFMRSDLENKVSNAVSMYRIAQSHSLPWNPKASPWSLQILRSSSTKSNTWLEPLRDMAHNSYEQINKAVAKNNIEVVRRLSAGAYQKRVLSRMKALHPTSGRKAQASKKAPTSHSHVWRLHSLVSPVKCVSIRSAPGHLGKRDPPMGTRYVVQACLRFDTLQSLTLSSASTTPAEPKRVLEYLVFEKKMWYDGPWLVRDQLWEGVLGEHLGPEGA